MNQAFLQQIDGLQESLNRLLSMQPTEKLPKDIPDKGVYLFSENGAHLYVGRSNNLRKRILTHGRSSAGHNLAAFAFNLAREATGRTKPTYKPEGSRALLLDDMEFADAFQAAKARVRAMEVRFIREDNPIRQALLEIYVAITLGAKFNKFDNH